MEKVRYYLNGSSVFGIMVVGGDYSAYHFKFDSYLHMQKIQTLPKPRGCKEYL